MSRYPKVVAKIGTVPMAVFLRRTKPLEVGQKVEFRQGDRWNKWQGGIVTCIDPIRITRM